MFNWRKLLGFEPPEPAGISEQLVTARERNQAAARRLEGLMEGDEPVIAAIRRIVEEVSQ